MECDSGDFDDGLLDEGGAEMQDIKIESVSGSGGHGQKKFSPWTRQEDDTLRQLVEEHGPKNWHVIASEVPGRGAKSCRLRWINHLADGLRSGPFTPEEDAIVIDAQAKFGNKWTLIAKLLPGRSDNNVKNRWNSALRKRVEANEHHLQLLAAFQQQQQQQQIQQQTRVQGSVLIPPTAAVTASGAGYSSSPYCPDGSTAQHAVSPAPAVAPVQQGVPLYLQQALAASMGLGAVQQQQQQYMQHLVGTSLTQPPNISTPLVASTLPLQLPMPLMTLRPQMTAAEAAAALAAASDPEKKGGKAGQVVLLPAPPTAVASTAQVAGSAPPVMLGLTHSAPGGMPPAACTAPGAAAWRPLGLFPPAPLGASGGPATMLAPHAQLPPFPSSAGSFGQLPGAGASALAVSPEPFPFDGPGTRLQSSQSALCGLMQRGGSSHLDLEKELTSALAQDSAEERLEQQTAKRPPEGEQEVKGDMPQKHHKHESGVVGAGQDSGALGRTPAAAEVGGLNPLQPRAGAEAVASDMAASFAERQPLTEAQEPPTVSGQHGQDVLLTKQQSAVPPVQLPTPLSYMEQQAAQIQAQQQLLQLQQQQLLHLQQLQQQQQQIFQSGLAGVSNWGPHMYGCAPAMGGPLEAPGSALPGSGSTAARMPPPPGMGYGLPPTPMLMSPPSSQCEARPAPVAMMAPAQASDIACQPSAQQPNYLGSMGVPESSSTDSGEAGALARRLRSREQIGSVCYDLLIRGGDEALSLLLTLGTRTMMAAYSQRSQGAQPQLQPQPLLQQQQQQQQQQGVMPTPVAPSPGSLLDAVEVCEGAAGASVRRGELIGSDEFALHDICSSPNVLDMQDWLMGEGSPEPSGAVA